MISSRSKSIVANDSSTGCSNDTLIEVIDKAVISNINGFKSVLSSFLYNCLMQLLIKTLNNTCCLNKQSILGTDVGCVNGMLMASIPIIFETDELK